MDICYSSGLFQTFYIHFSIIHRDISCYCF